MIIRVLIFLVCFTVPSVAKDFEITRPDNIATMTMPCWSSRELSETLTVAQFDSVTHGLLVAKTDVKRPLIVVWMHLLSGKAAITISHPGGEECLAAVLVDAE